MRETALDVDRFVMPLFVVPGEGVVNRSTGSPGIAQRSVDEIVREAERARVALGVRAVLLFGIPEEKDDEGSGAWDDGRHRPARAARAARRGARADC